MPDKRIWLPGQHYHILNRGVRKGILFYDDSDYEFFLNLLVKTNLKYPFKLTSFCLMNNHYHLQFQSTEIPISIIMEHINKLYARYFNNKNNYIGPVFQGRFTSKLVKDNRGILHLCRYIIYNPVEAKIVTKPELYKWSSFSYFSPFNEISIPDYMDISPVLNQFSGSTYQKKQRFLEWCGY